MVRWTPYNKYKVAPKEERTYRGILFASKGEMLRWIELKQLEEWGIIEDLIRQVTFDLVVNGKLIGHYRPDFGYRENGKVVFEDFKGARTQEFKLKWKLAQALYPQYEWKLTTRAKSR